jgi:hypothetical protein
MPKFPVENFPWAHAVVNLPEPTLSSTSHELAPSLRPPWSPSTIVPNPEPVTTPVESSVRGTIFPDPEPAMPSCSSLWRRRLRAVPEPTMASSSLSLWRYQPHSILEPATSTSSQSPQRHCPPRARGTIDPTPSLSLQVCIISFPNLQHHWFQCWCMHLCNVDVVMCWLLFCLVLWPICSLVIIYFSMSFWAHKS